MNIQTLKIILLERNLKPSEIARMAGVSRAAVTKWFKESVKTGWANVETNTLVKLGESLGVEPSILLTKPLPLKPLETRFLWDHLYPDMESFLTAIRREEQPAIARLVQVVGFHEAENVAGKKIVTHFDSYKKYLKPARRKQLEVLWLLYNSPI